MFFGDAGGQGCAAEKNGVPVVRGLGRGSATGDLFRGAVSFLARATETSLRKSPGGHNVSSIFSWILVNVIFGHVCSAEIAAERGFRHWRRRRRRRRCSGGSLAPRADSRGCCIHQPWLMYTATARIQRCNFGPLIAPPARSSKGSKMPPKWEPRSDFSIFGVPHGLGEKEI